MHDTIERQITRIARDRCGSRPSDLTSCVSRYPVEDGETIVLKLDHPYLKGTAFNEHGIPDASDGEELSAHGKHQVEFAIDEITRRENRSALFDKIAGNPDGDRPWIKYSEAPSWSLLAHPIFVHALMRSGANDLTGKMLQNTATPSPGVRVRVLQDLLIGQCPLDPLNPSRGRVFSDDMGLVLEIGDTIPHVTRTALIGKPIGELIELPPCGDSELDAETAQLLISEIQDTIWMDRPGILVIPSRATWRGCAPVPPRVNEQELRQPGRTI